MTALYITQYYESDHDRLDELFKNFQKSKRSDLPKAREFFEEFKYGLERHITWEEEILFPLFEQRTGMHGSGPTHVMRSEHRQILKHLEAIDAKLSLNDRESDYDEQMMLNVLAMHNLKEEQVLYPSIDRTLSDEERAGVFSRMKEFPGTSD